MPTRTTAREVPPETNPDAAAEAERARAACRDRGRKRNARELSPPAHVEAPLDLPDLRAAASTPVERPPREPSTAQQLLVETPPVEGLASELSLVETPLDLPSTPIERPPREPSPAQQPLAAASTSDERHASEPSPAQQRGDEAHHRRNLGMQPAGAAVVALFEGILASAKQPTAAAQAHPDTGLAYDMLGVGEMDAVTLETKRGSLLAAGHALSASEVHLGMHKSVHLALTVTDEMDAGQRGHLAVAIGVLDPTENADARKRASGAMLKLGWVLRCHRRAAALITPTRLHSAMDEDRRAHSRRGPLLSSFKGLARVFENKRTLAALKRVLEETEARLDEPSM